MEKFFHINGKHLECQYAIHLSDYTEWDFLEHAEDWILYKENIGTNLSIDETSLSQGELYTIITNKDAKGKKGALVAMVKGTNSKEVIDVLNKIPEQDRDAVKEVTLDMASSMNKIVLGSFPKAVQVIDRFHVQKLAYEALQQMRVFHRWEALEQENKEYELAKETGVKFIAQRLENGDTFKQLLARSRYLLFKQKKKWTPKQWARAEILFKYYPDLERAYGLVQDLGCVYRSSKEKGIAYTKLARWHNEVDLAGFKQFNTLSKIIKNHYQRILNFFDNRSTNASAESFNAKIKAFRNQFRGLKRIPFFLYRLTKIYA